MAKALIIVSILLVIALVVIAGFMAGVIPWQRGAPSVTPGPALQTTPSPGPAPAPTLLSTPPPSPPSTPLSTPAPSPPSSPGAYVQFGFAITDITGSGLSRTVSAQLNNTGTSDAHNVWAKVQAFIGNSSIKLNGQDSLRVDVGTLKAGGSVTKQVTLSFGLIDSLKIMQQGVHLELTIFSDERSEAFTYDYKP